MTNRVVEVDEEGSLHLPSDVLEHAPQHTQYIVNASGETIVLRRVAAPTPFWATATPQERAEDLVRWAASHTTGPTLPEAALRREHLYS